MAKYEVNVSSSELSNKFKEDFPGVSFQVFITVEDSHTDVIDGIEAAYRKVLKLLLDKEIRHAIAGCVHLTGD